MTIYILLLILMFCCAWFIPAQDQSKRTGLLFVVVMTAGLICGLGDMLGGYDRYIYAEVFDGTAIDLKKGIPLWETTAMELNEKEKGYALFNIIIAYLTGNRYIFILLLTLFVYVSLFFHVSRYSKYAFLAFFILMCMWHFFTYTYLRQCMAAAIVWHAIPFAVKRKPIPFFAIVVLAASFHNSALLFSFVYFVANKRFTKKQIMNAFIIGLLLGFTPIGSFLMTSLGGAINEEKANLSAQGASGSARFDYILEAIFFLYVVITGYRQLPKEGMKLAQFNILLLFVFTLIFFVRFGDGGRMSWYFLIGVACTTSDLVMQKFNDEKWRIALFAVMITLYLRVLILWEFNMCPYKTFLTPGHTAAEWIYEQFEYDYNYDENKFYNL